jgi:hypothetical protein
MEGENKLCAALGLACSGGHQRGAVLLLNGRFHSKKRPAFEIGKKSRTATNDKFNKVRYLK